LVALESEQDVSGACLYSAGGRRFADYTRLGSKVVFPEQPAADGHRFERGHLALFRPIVFNGKRIGTIYLQADLQRVYDQLRLFGVIVLLVLFGSCFVAFALASPLQRPISGPILSLTVAIRQIAADKNYTARMPQYGQNESGQLANAINQFLASIEERDTALGAEIGQRKEAEDKVRAQLGRLELLHHITQATGERQDLKSIFQVVIRTLEEHLPVRSNHG
jgi:methyl-accepting chemotaxis protein